MISKKLKYVLIFMFGALFLAPTLLQAKGDKKDGKTTLKKTTADQTASTLLNINNISTWFYNTGESDITPNGNSGFVFPKGSGKAAVFTSGLLWGARVIDDPDPRVGGTAYRTGLVQGNVDANGNAPADNTTNEKYRIYRVRPDIFPGGDAVDLSTEAASEGTTEAALRAAYEKDWTEWPADMGAPYDDKDLSGTYNAGDVPGVPGSDQTIWFVTNDLTASQTVFLYGANPLGLEVSETIWAYNRAGALGNMYFRKYTFTNVTNRPALTPTTFNNMYVSMWSDVDLGEAGDDFVGVDTVLSLQYSYNANADDATYTPLPPPAVGFDFFQGPLVDGVLGQDINRNDVDDAVDFGIFNGAKVGPGKINLPMTAAYYFANGDATIGDPPQGTVDGSRQFYNFFQGKFGISGATFTDLATGQPTTYALNGNPQAGTGWLDGIQLPPGDRRQGSASGPFNMAPGEVQEVVVAEIIGGAIPGTDRLSAIGILKFYDQQAQQAYDNFFDLPDAPPAPGVTAVALENKIILDWGSDLAKVAATESNNAKGFAFQGYNVYQLPTASSLVESGKRLATFDKIDGIGKIEDKFFDSNTGVVATKVVQFGNDVGIQRSLTITQDAVKGGLPLVNGIKYYFAVTSYNYNPSPTAVPNNLENPITILTVIPQTTDPGVTQSKDVGLTTTHASGTANAGVSVKVVDPAKVTGHNYQFFFNLQDYVNDASGNWTKVASTTKNNGGLKTGDVSPSTVSFTGEFGDIGGTLKVVGTLDLVSPEFDFVDGVKLEFPSGVTINSGETISNCANGNTANPVINGTTIMWGDSSRSGFGCFSGGSQQMIMNISATLPITINYTVYDDDYGVVYSVPGAISKDAIGSFNLTTATSQRVTQRQWGLKDVTLGKNVLENQTVIDNTDIAWGIGPGGSPGKLLGADVGSNYTVTVDGLEVAVTSGGYDAPINWNTISINSSATPKTAVRNSTAAGGTGIRISNYTVFGGTITSKAIDNFGQGTNVIEDLQKDYELRFTGVLDTSVVNGYNLVQTISGGSMATIFSGLNGAAIGAHPLNPSPGSGTPFQMRIPLEVWSIDDNQQVNLTFRDRLQNWGAGPGTSLWYSWNIENRMYAIFVNSPYSDTQPIQMATADANNALATWVIVFWATHYAVGDVVTVTYANPIQAGVDTYTFSTTAKAFSAASAATDVEKINVFPNPYYGVNTEELNKYQKFVTFNHLPANAKIRIFNLAGIMVKTIDKIGGSQYERWDLQNENGLPVASGIYIAYIDMPDLGTTKILKLAVIQEEQILDRF